VVNPEQGRDLAQCLGPDRVVLMRGHGFAAGAPSLFQVVKTAVYLPLNARTLKEGLQLGEVKTLSPGEVAVRATTDPDAPASRRAWEYWCRRVNMTPYWEL
jgi:HCOMODA/2-hydroxy-3-carboxy-muconic semialdehyde decarboxylase